MRRTLIAAVCFALVGLGGQLASAAIIGGQYVPDELVNAYGKEYRLVFVTSGSIQAKDLNPVTYDNFLASQVLGTMLGDFDYGWKAVISTETPLFPNVARIAKDIVSDLNYGVDPSKYVGVYNTGGTKVAATGDAMLTSSLINPVAFDQNGTFVYDGYAWTGSFANGMPAITLPSGKVGDVSGYTMVGATGSNDGRWLQLGTVFRGDNTLIPFVGRVYGMSDVLTVPTPEPATVVLWSVCGAIAGLVYWRKRGSSK